MQPAQQALVGQIRLLGRGGARAFGSAAAASASITLPNGKSLELADGDIKLTMPAEWAPHVGTWMAWPKRYDVWRSGAGPARAAFTEVIKAISQFEPVTVIAAPELVRGERAACLCSCGLIAPCLHEGGEGLTAARFRLPLRRRTAAEPALVTAASFIRRLLIWWRRSMPSCIERVDAGRGALSARPQAQRLQRRAAILCRAAAAPRPLPSSCPLPATCDAPRRPKWSDARAALPDHVRVIEMTHDDSWLRDSGPTVRRGPREQQSLPP
jgi:hypothetical protein